MTPPQHLHFFTKKGIVLLLEGNGFRILTAKYQTKYVPGGRILYQITRRLGLKLKLSWVKKFNTFGVPVNLFDTLTILAQKVS